MTSQEIYFVKILDILDFQLTFLQISLNFVLQECYVHNLLRVTVYLPTLRLQILELIVEKLLKLDVSLLCIVFQRRITLKYSSVLSLTKIMFQQNSRSSEQGCCGLTWQAKHHTAVCLHPLSSLWDGREAGGGFQQAGLEEVSLPIARGLELVDIKVPFQPKPLYDTMTAYFSCLARAYLPCFCPCSFLQMQVFCKYSKIRVPKQFSVICKLGDFPYIAFYWSFMNMFYKDATLLLHRSKQKEIKFSLLRTVHKETSPQTPKLSVLLPKNTTYHQSSDTDYRTFHSKSSAMTCC